MNPGSLGPWSKDGSRSLALPTRSQGRKAHSRDRNRRGRAFLCVLGKTMVPKIFPFNPVTCWFKKGVYRMRLSERGHHRIQSLIRSWFSCEYGREFLGEFSVFGLYQRRVKSSFGLIQTFCMAIFIGNDDFLNHGILMYHTFTQTSVLKIWWIRFWMQETPQKWTMLLKSPSFWFRAQFFRSEIHISISKSCKFVSKPQIWGYLQYPVFR